MAEMQVTFYNNASPREEVNKNLSVIAGPMDIRLLDSTDIEKPIIVYEGGFPAFNYAYLSEFDRYYYVVGKKSFVNGLWTLYLEEDYIYTWRNSIKSHTALVERQEYEFNPYLKDNLVPMTNDTQQYIKKFTNGISFGTENKIVYVNPYINHTLNS